MKAGLRTGYYVLRLILTLAIGMASDTTRDSPRPGGLLRLGARAAGSRQDPDDQSGRRRQWADDLHQHARRHRRLDDPVTPASANSLGLNMSQGTPAVLLEGVGAAPALTNVPSPGLAPNGSSTPVTPPVVGYNDAAAVHDDRWCTARKRGTLGKIS